MIFPVALISAFFFISGSLGSEDLCEVKYAQLLSKQQEVDNLRDLINQQNSKIEQLKGQISDLKKTSELATLDEIVKIGGVDKNNPTTSNNSAKKVEVKTAEETIDFPDPCLRNQKQYQVLRELQLPGSDPFKVVCRAYSELGSGWLNVGRKLPSSKTFNRTYEDYERGFGAVGTGWHDEFFIGLSRLHILTSGKPHEVLFWTGAWSRICDHFVVGGPSEGYTVKSIDNCTGEDLWLSPNKGSKFSTFDRDEDGLPGRNLTKARGYGWWFDPGMSTNADYGIYMYIRRTD